jgi:hypothetical protein
MCTLWPVLSTAGRRNRHIFTAVTFEGPIPVAAPSKEWSCGRSLAGIMGSKPARGMDTCVASVVCCQVEVSASG